ncbi:MAG: hypothetical protein AAB152_02945 [Candidatus Coatesbacteria bacterium]
MMLRACALLAGLAAVSGSIAATVDPGGLSGTTPRAVALAGSDVAYVGGSPLTGGSVADLARLDGPALAGGGGVATRGGGTGLSLRGGGAVEGFGVAGSAVRWSRGVARGLDAGVAAATPAGPLPGVSFGLGLDVLTRALGSDTAAGLSMDLGVSGRFDLRWQGVEVAAAAALEHALGTLSWDSGATEQVPSRTRLGLGVHRGPVAVVTELALVRGPGAREGVWGAGVEHAFAISGLPVAARAGWHDRPGTVCAGFGAALGAATLDYAVAAGRIGVLHSLAVGWRFPGPGAGASAAPRRLASPRASRPGTTGRPAGRDAEVVPERDVFALDNPWRTMALAIRVPADEATRSWTVLISAPDGTVVWEAAGDGVPPRAVTWAGTSVTGEPVAAGTYTCRLLLRGAAAPDYLSPGSAIRVVRPPLRAASPGPTLGGFDVPDAAAGGGR